MNRKSIVAALMLVLLTMIGSTAQAPDDPRGTPKGPRQVFPVAPRAGTPRAIPANDAFASATAVTLPLPYTNVVADFNLATGETGEPTDCIYLDPLKVIEAGITTIWYSITPAEDMIVTLDTDGSTFDTVINVYTGPAINTLNLIDCNDDFSVILDAGLTSRITGLSITAGTTYWIRIAVFNNELLEAGESATLSIKETPVAGTFTVNSTTDAVDASIGDGQCATVGSVCTLRAAINESNASQPGSTIHLPAGIYKTTIDAPVATNGSQLFENAAVNGDFDIHTAVTIIGGGAQSTIIDGGAHDTVMEFFSGANVVMNGVTVRNGHRVSSSQAAGGGLRLNENAAVTLDDVWVTGNKAVFGGGITVEGGTLTMTDSAITANIATGTPSISGNGGAIEVRDFVSDDVTISLTNVTISGNSAVTGNVLVPAAGGGIFLGEPNGAGDLTATLNNTTIAANSASNGGGVFTSAGVDMTTDNTLIGNNTATSNPDCKGSIGSTGFNVIGNAAGCTTVAGDKINQDVRLNALFLNAPGQTPTNLVRTSSPARDTGNPATCAAVDQRGIARPQYSKCDIGALEAMSAVPGAFTQITPADEVLIPSASGLTGLTWQRSLNAYSYVVTIDNISSGTAVNVYTANFTAAKVCNPTTCSVSFTQPLPDNFYSYKVTAYADTNTTSAAVAHVFQVDSVAGLPNLIPNASFETKGTDKQPASWKVSNITGDKRVCNKTDLTVAHDGECAYRFKGSSKEKTALKRKQDLTNITFAAGDTVRLTFYASPGTVSATAMLKVAYKSKSLAPSKVKFALPNGDSTYLPFSSELTLVNHKATKAIVKFTNKSTSGKWYVDTVRVVHISSTVRQDQAVQTRSAGLLPPPAAPDGFRGQN